MKRTTGKLYLLLLVYGFVFSELCDSPVKLVQRDLSNQNEAVIFSTSQGQGQKKQDCVFPRLAPVTSFPPLGQELV